MGMFDFLRSNKSKQVDINQLYRMLFQYVNFGEPLANIVNQNDAINKGYMYNHIVYSIVNRIVNAIAGVPFSVYTVTDKTKVLKAKEAYNKKDYQAAIYYKSQAYELNTTSEINNLIVRPNEYEQFNELIMQLASFYLITGNGYLYGLRQQTGDKRIIGLYTMPANEVEIIFGSYLKPVRGYRLNNFLDGVIPADDVMHIKSFNPQYNQRGSWLYGLSPIQAAGSLTQLSNYAYQTQLQNFSNYGIRGLLSGKDNNLSTQQAVAIKEHYNAQKSSKGDIMVVGAPLEWLNIGLSPVDLDIIEQQKLTLRDLCMIYNVPSQLFGDSEHTTYSNMKEARKALITDAALPLLERIKDGLNRFIGADDILIDYDMQVFSELQDDMQQQVTSLSQAWWLTGNEKRLAMGKTPFDNETMDNILVPSGLIPIDEMNYSEYDGTTNEDDDVE